MLEVVDELERNGQNLQHFSRELSRYFRNLLVARIAGADTRLVAASAAQREKLAADRGAVLRRGPDAVSPALARSLPRSAILVAAPLPPGDRARTARARRPAAADRAGTGRDEAGRANRAAAAACAGPHGASAGRPNLPRAKPSPFELDRAKKAATAAARRPKHPPRPSRRRTATGGSGCIAP